MKGEGELDRTAKELMISLATNAKKFASMIQLSRAETQWQVLPKDQNKRLIHIAAESGLKNILTKLLRRQMISVLQVTILS